MCQDIVDVRLFDSQLKVSWVFEPQAPCRRPGMLNLNLLLNDMRLVFTNGGIG